MRVISHPVLPFIAAFPLPREDVRIPAAYAEARLAVELAAELIHTAAIKAPLLMAPWSPGREGCVAFGAQVDFGENRKRFTDEATCHRRSGIHRLKPGRGAGG